jgi:hypothetical protein
MIFDTLSEALFEVMERLPVSSKVGIFVLKTKDESPYWPIYVMPPINIDEGVQPETLYETIDRAQQVSGGEVVAIFATIR